MADLDLTKLIREETYNKPVRCSKCGSVLKYLGVGEYRCETCGYKEYDDYGIVRAYVENNPGASVYQTEAATGVSAKVITNFVRTGRLSLKNSNQN